MSTATIIQHLLNGAPKNNRTQRVTVTGTGGTFTLTHSNHTTAAIAYGTAAAAVQTAIAALAGVGAGNVSVTGTGPYIVTFSASVADVLMTATSSLAGTGAGVAVAAITPLRGLVSSTNIRARKLPDGWNNTAAAVVITRQGGAPESGVALDVPLFSLRCYGGFSSGAAVDAVADAVTEALHDRFSETNSSGRIVSARVSQRMDSTDPDFPDCPVVILLAELTIGG